VVTKSRTGPKTCLQTTRLGVRIRKKAPKTIKVVKKKRRKENKKIFDAFSIYIFLFIHFVFEWDAIMGRTKLGPFPRHVNLLIHLFHPFEEGEREKERKASFFFFLSFFLDGFCFHRGEGEEEAVACARARMHARTHARKVSPIQKSEKPERERERETFG
jgi:hypothetical protein